MKWTAALVVDALRDAYGLSTGYLDQEEWSLLTEVPLRATEAARSLYGRETVNRYTANTRTIDVLLVRNWSSGVGHRRVAVEVKVSRSDYRNETDAKRAPAEQSAHQTTYAAPVGLIDPKSLPEGWGLIEVYDTRGAAARGAGWVLGDEVRSRCRWRVRPVERAPACDVDYLVSSVARKGSRLAERLRRGEDAAAEVTGLREEVERLQGALARRDEALHRVQDRLRKARGAVASVAGDQVCADCGGGLRYAVDSVWKHLDPLGESRCYQIRATLERDRRQAAMGAGYLLGYAPPVETVEMRATRLREQATDAVLSV